jgi:DNA/RNA endonuclease YhcR with UshA esterase domain
LFATAARAVSNLGMKRIFALAALATLAATMVRADETNTPTSTPAPAPVRIGTADADKHLDESVVVTGKVAQVTIHTAIVFLNMDQPFPDSPLTAVIMAKNTNGFGDLKSLEGKAVEISGKLKAFHDKPEIVLESTNQLLVVDTNTPAPAKN